MKFFDRVLKKAGFMRASEVGQIIGAYLTNVWGVGVVPEKTYAQLVDAYKSWVYTCIDKIAKAVAMIPLNLFIYRRQGKKVIDLSWRAKFKMMDKPEQKYFLKQMGMEREEITDHIFLDLIHKPNAFMTRFMLWYETLVRLELGGMCGWYLPPNRLKVPQEIWPLPLTKYAALKPKVSTDLRLEYWDYTDAEVKRRFEPDEILLMKYPHPASPFMAMSPLMAQTYPYDLDLFLMQQQRGLFQNMAVPGLQLTTEQKMTKPQIKEFKDYIDETYGGALKSGGTMVFHSGLKADKLGITGREAMLDKVAQFAREKLITSFDLSEGKIGLVRDVNRANMEALNETFILECLKPKCMLIEEVLETFLLPRYDQGLTCDFELPDIEQKEIILKERKENLENFLTVINEERAKMGLESVEWGDKPWGAFNMVQLEAGEGGKKKKLPGETTKPEEEEEDEGKVVFSPDWAQ